MLRPRFAFVLGALAAVGLATAGCADQSVAIRVGDETVSEQELTDEMTALRDNEPALQLIIGATRDDVVGDMGDDSFGQPFVAYMVEQRVFLMLQHQLADQEGVEVTDAEIDAMRSNVESQLEAGGADAGDLPDDYVDQLVDDLAISQALQDQLQPDEFQEAFIELAEATDVELSSRLGEWDSEVFLGGLQGQGQQTSAVTPPAAPQPAPGDESGADVGLPAG